ncbi:MAG: bifunctional 5,10-methylenetetrahydrofolate dehydrogenase/5,10-methenyltetrahydrofolate cyclohydrolase [Fidelibacterota bacterium]|nr:MAG: bifunctional 5,10-methylenetetrahydrofolate dehydrogenase/5,10-methenyltetrahydrofolate cyclohydrolase [Candidatus Neomarinimicrobiota bacterium]
MSVDTILLKGKPVAEAAYERLKPRIAALRGRNVIPGLAVVLVGDDPASAVYVRSKTRAFQNMELVSETYNLPATTTEKELLQLIDRLNDDEHFHGILVQLPLPSQINSQTVLERVLPLKDVDGFHPDSLGRLLAGEPRYIPCTPQGILEILNHYEIPTARRHAVVVGRSTIVGKPMMALLANKWGRGNATVTVCHTSTPDIAAHTRQADLLIIASGQPHLVTREMVSEGVDIVDVGVNRVPDDSPKGYHLEGDVATDDMLGLAHAITPVPGGVGPMTVAMLVSNTVLAAEISSGAAS